ncbi:MAG: hypothetical protein J6S53_04930 [Lentisphaeria bacterium]|nr:hypothetical protein [Lentisphaeria bacterium]
MDKKKIFFFSGLLVLLWCILTFFTIDWDLPSRYTPETDGITAKLDLSPKEMMKADTYKYPPLQYLIVKSLAEDVPEKTLAKENLTFHRSKRIFLYRMTSSVMGLMTAFLLVVSAVVFLKMPLLYALGAGGIFLLSPLVLFYSQSANMDMPCTFWFILSLFFAVCAEYIYEKREEKKKYILFHILAGVAAGCAFCTKDQVYSLYILPAMGFIYWKWRKNKDFFKSLLPVLFWGGGFLFSTLLIYFLIGFEVVVPHFKWITTEGSSPYAATGKGIADRLKLLWTSSLFLGKAMDYPLLILMLFSAIYLFRKKDIYKKEKGVIILLLLFFLVFSSQFFFFCQVVRYSQIRYFLPVLPFVILFCFFILYKETAVFQKRKILSLSLFFLLFWQMGIAWEYLYALANSPLASLKKEIVDSSLHKELRINTLMAQEGEKYLQKTDGKVEKRKCIRSWGSFLGLEEYGINDLLNEDLSFFLMKPELVISNKNLDSAGKYFLTLQKVYSSPLRILPSLYGEKNEERFYLYSAGRKIDFLPDFRKKCISEQIIRLNYLLPYHSNFSFEEMKMIGGNLAPFTVPDSGKYLINNYMYRFLLDAYTASGRMEEAGKCRKMLSTVF